MAIPAASVSFDTVVWVIPYSLSSGNPASSMVSLMLLRSSSGITLFGMSDSFVTIFSFWSHAY